MVTYYQEGLDHRNTKDNEKVREWLKMEFNGEFITMKGKAIKVPGSTKNKLKEFTERVMDWMNGEGYQVELLDPKDYKKWRDTVFPFGGPDNFIDYLEETGKLKKCVI
jgi:hypothetical protein